jgi:hypothetical protein
MVISVDDADPAVVISGPVPVPEAVSKIIELEVPSRTILPEPVISPPTSILEDADTLVVAKVLDPVRKVKSASAAITPSALNCICVLLPAGVAVAETFVKPAPSPKKKAPEIAVEPEMIG